MRTARCRTDVQSGRPDPGSRQDRLLWIKGAILHTIVLGGLFLMPIGCGEDVSKTALLTASTSGQGTVTASPAGFTFNVGTTVTLTATPSDGWTFDHWEGALSGSANPATVTMNTDKQVTAVFVLIGNNNDTCTEWEQTDISTDTMIPAGCWLINSNIRIHNNATLTIAPGATLKFAQNRYLEAEADGALYAVGTAAQPIVLTGQTQSPGWWVGVWFDNSNSPDNKLEYVTIEYGGVSSGGRQADLVVWGTSRVAISHCTLRHSSGYGFSFRPGATITFDANTVTANAMGAGEIDPTLMSVLTPTSTYTGNTVNTIFVDGGYTEVDQTWSNLGVDYQMRGSLNVDKHTTFAAGIQVKFPTSAWLEVQSTGSLTAVGTVGQPIVLTGTTASPGWWVGVWFDVSNSPDNKLEYVTIEYGGVQSGGIKADLVIWGASTVSMDTCTIRHSSGYGIWKSKTSSVTGIATTQYLGNASTNLFNEP